jgi:carbonic anhydrase/acetyltransferase-like protein (isoleucine patch superfamily)
MVLALADRRKMREQQQEQQNKSYEQSNRSEKSDNLFFVEWGATVVGEVAIGQRSWHDVLWHSAYVLCKVKG